MIVLSIVNFVVIAFIAYITYEQVKKSRNLEHDVSILKRAKKLDHTRFNQSFKSHEHYTKREIKELAQHVSNLKGEFEKEILDNRKVMEVSTKEYLNNWRNSTEFKSMLELIRQAERSGDSKNIY
jgi:Na+-transporting NADH:ubiquinone oxidoreductase subunit NqrC